jgi:hypothetical protein
VKKLRSGNPSIEKTPSGDDAQCSLCGIIFLDDREGENWIHRVNFQGLCHEASSGAEKKFIFVISVCNYLCMCKRSQFSIFYFSFDCCRLIQINIHSNLTLILFADSVIIVDGRAAIFKSGIPIKYLGPTQRCFSESLL